MEAKTFIVAALALGFAVSCTKNGEESFPSNIDKDNGITVISSFNAAKGEYVSETKTVLEGKKAVWVKNDEVAAFDKDGKGIKFTAAADGQLALFETSEEGLSEGSDFMMLYPFSETAQANMGGKTIAFNVPAEQKAVKGSFDPKADASVADATAAGIASGETVEFKNALSLLKFTVPAAIAGKIAKITVEAKGVNLAGDVVYDIRNMTSSISSNGSSSVVLKSAKGMEEGVYYVAVRPETLTDGVEVTATLYDKTYYSKASSTAAGKTFSFKRNTIYDFGEIASAGWSYTEFEYVVTTAAGGTRASGATTCKYGAGTETQYRTPGCLTWMPDGKILLGDTGAQCFSTFDAATNTTALWTDSMGGKINAPWHMVFVGKDLYFANKAKKLISKITDGGTTKTLVDVTTAFAGSQIYTVAFDSDGNMFTHEDDSNGYLYKYEGTDKSKRSQFATVKGLRTIHFLSDNSIIAATTFGRFAKVSPDGKTVTTIAGLAKGAATTLSDGTPFSPKTAGLGTVTGSYIMPDGTIYFVDYSLHAIRMLVPDAYGTYTNASVVTVAGGTKGFADATGKAAQFNNPVDLLVTEDGKTIYVSDLMNFRLRKVEIREKTTVLQ